MTPILLGALALSAWAYLVLAHGDFWLPGPELDGTDPDPAIWPEVAVVVPARDEADVLAVSLASLAEQQYAGPLSIVLVDDESSDGTAEVARTLAKSHAGGHRIDVVRTAPRPNGWVGKMWALETGLHRTHERSPAAEFVLFTDADVAHHPGSVRRLVCRAEARGLDLVSLMVQLRAETTLERLLVPAFVYFFQKLYPFSRVNDPGSRTAGAAGGCMLVRRRALHRAGGLVPLRGAIIDDCALGAAIKRGGPIWLGHSRSERSVRAYGGLAGVWRMVARSAFTQLHHSLLRLAGAVVGLLLLYVAPPLLVLLAATGSVPPVAGALGLGAWLAMAASFMPTLVRHGQPPALSLALPVAGVLYTLMTLDSARLHLAGRGAAWKGRAGAGSEQAARRGD